MRRRIQLSIGILEATLACVLFVIGGMLPGTESVENSFTRVQHVSRNAESQVRLMREQVAEVRHHDFPRVSAHLRAQTRGFSARWKHAPVDFPTVEAMNDTVLASAVGLDDWSDTLDVKGRFRETRPASRRDAPQANSLARATQLTRASLEESAAQLDEECRALLTNVGRPLDASAIVQSVSTVERMRILRDQLEYAGSSERFNDLRRATGELENSLETAHRHVELASTAAFPLLVPNGSSQPDVQLVPLWPQGKEAARSLSTTLTAVRNTNQQLDAFARAFRAVKSSKGDANPENERATIETLVDCSQRLRSLSAALQRNVSAVQRSTAEWPGLVQTMRVSARVLRDSHEQLDEFAGKQSEYDRAMQGSRQATQTAEQIVESYSERIGNRLSEQEHSLAEMEHGLGEASEAIPAVSNTTVDLLNAIRWMFWLVGALIALHGAFVICEARSKPLPSLRKSEPAA
jgi:hypothetical protein